MIVAKTGRSTLERDTDACDRFTSDPSLLAGSGSVSEGKGGGDRRVGTIRAWIKKPLARLVVAVALELMARLR